MSSSTLRTLNSKLTPPKFFINWSKILGSRSFYRSTHYGRQRFGYWRWTTFGTFGRWNRRRNDWRIWICSSSRIFHLCSSWMSCCCYWSACCCYPTFIQETQKFKGRNWPFWSIFVGQGSIELELRPFLELSKFWFFISGCQLGGRSLNHVTAGHHVTENDIQTTMWLNHTFVLYDLTNPPRPIFMPNISHMGPYNFKISEPYNFNNSG